MTQRLIVFLLTAILILPITESFSEFYEYTDENGVKTFTDDPGMIPDSKREGANIHKEPYDDLSDEERKKKIAEDQAEIREIEQKRKAWQINYQRQEERRRKQEEEIRKKQQQKRISTPVVIRNNQILVPVTLRTKNKTVDITLLLDTGASITVINKHVAEKLTFTNAKRSRAQVANGQIVKTLVASVDSINVGPKMIEQHVISVIPYMGRKNNFDGLLGLDFLKHFEYDIDYENSLIIWKN